MTAVTVLDACPAWAAPYVVAGLAVLAMTALAPAGQGDAARALLAHLTPKDHRR